MSKKYKRLGRVQIDTENILAALCFHDADIRGIRLHPERDGVIEIILSGKEMPKVYKRGLIPIVEPVYKTREDGSYFRFPMKDGITEKR